MSTRDEAQRFSRKLTRRTPSSSLQQPLPPIQPQAQLRLSRADLQCDVFTSMSFTMSVKWSTTRLDVRSCGALRMLVLMAMADGVLATEEQVMLDTRANPRSQSLKAGIRPFRTQWTSGRLPRTLRLPIALWPPSCLHGPSPAVRTMGSLSIRRSGCVRHLAKNFELTEPRRPAIEEGPANSLPTCFWDIVMNTFSNQFMLDTDPNPLTSSN